MAHNEENPMVRIELVVPKELAEVFAAKPQFVYSERMQAELLSILTDEQIQALLDRKVQARPLIFPKTAVRA